jgi:hypothetical protein
MRASTLKQRAPRAPRTLVHEADLFAFHAMRRARTEHETRGRGHYKARRYERRGSSTVCDQGFSTFLDTQKVWLRRENAPGGVADRPISG